MELEGKNYDAKKLEPMHTRDLQKLIENGYFEKIMLRLWT